MKTLGIVAHSAEGSALCYLTACRYGAERLGAFMHPTIVMSAVPMGLSMSGWESGKHSDVAVHLTKGIHLVAEAGADFYVCPDNTAHIVLEQIAAEMPIPGLHIADAVCTEIKSKGWGRAGILGTDWTMTGTVYARALGRQGIELIVPDSSLRKRVNDVIFGELCRGVFTEDSRAFFLRAIHELQRQCADCVILGCTEIPMIVEEAHSPLPTVDSTRLLARSAVDEAVSDATIDNEAGWIRR